MYRGGDSVFRLSLVGIAFILICFLLIVFSRMYIDAEARSVALDKSQSAQTMTPEAFESAKQELLARLSEEGVNADEVIRDLRDKAKIETELAIQKKRTQELGAEVIGLTEAKRILRQAGRRSSSLNEAGEEALLSALELRARLAQELFSQEEREESKLDDSEIVSRALAAINFKRNIETIVKLELKEPELKLEPGHEPAWGRWLLTNSELFLSILNGPAGENRVASSENPTLRAQIDFLLSRHNTAPPCWFDKSGRPQFLLTIELQSGRPESVTVAPGWPITRRASALAIPDINELLALKQMPYPAFKEHAEAISKYTSSQQCRHSVQVADNMRSGMRSERIHQELEAFFHLESAPLP